MRKLISIFTLLLTLNNYAQERNCSDFKTGTFRYTNIMFPEKMIRTDSLQIEIHPKTGVEIWTTVEWTTDCSYILTYKKILNYDIDVSDKIGEKIYVEIIETDGKKYRAKVKSKSTDQIVEFIKTDNSTN